MNGWWRMGAGILAGVVIAMIGFWLVEAREYVSRDDVRTVVQETSAYSQDRRFITTSLERIESGVQDTNGSVIEIHQRLNILEQRMARLEERTGQEP